ncbi:MAG: hypothetical protein ACOH2H_22080 [Cypionkella sp.]
MTDEKPDSTGGRQADGHHGLHGVAIGADRLVHSAVASQTCELPVTTRIGKVQGSCLILIMAQTAEAKRNATARMH